MEHMQQWPAWVLGTQGSEADHDEAVQGMPSAADHLPHHIECPLALASWSNTHKELTQHRTCCPSSMPMPTIQTQCHDASLCDPVCCRMRATRLL